LIAGARQLFRESEDQEFVQKYQAALEQEPENGDGPFNFDKVASLKALARRQYDRDTRR
jgi:hypothetical protein